ncbi:endogenous retrovirus group K member 21 Pro protein-like [Callospermophilus lateralis]|uniref:endogenous retrovirus group K member 21 Pro protein-like n=1 Tax=Callospermophilus lateralis TaxID=76772 RepID=UPI0040539A4A
MPPGERIAQLLLLPAASLPSRALKAAWSNDSFASTGTPQTFWVAHLDSRPQLTIKIQDKIFKGILYSGADVSVISKRQWPSAWPLLDPSAVLQGIGQRRPEKSAFFLKWRDEEGHSGYFQPYVVAGLPTNLWGRDLLQQMGAILTTQTLKGSNKFVNDMMLDMGWLPGKGLGKRHEGRATPVDPTEEITRSGGGRRGLGNLS